MLLKPKVEKRFVTAPPIQNNVPQSKSVSFDATVLFCDMRGSSKITEELTSDISIGIFRGFLNSIAKIITKNGGRIRQIVGDRILAFYPKRPDNKDCSQAINTAMEVTTFVEYIFNPEVLGKYSLDLSSGIGIDRGKVQGITAGIYGRTSTQDPIWVGYSVPSASKMCDAALRKTVVISEEVYNVLPSGYVLSGSGINIWSVGQVKIGELSRKVLYTDKLIDLTIMQYLQSNRRT